MEAISPLAQVLAEANGIDWRRISGTGDGGTVVEQDILSYLSRVMSGDEDPPATPVDETPEGWTGEMPAMPPLPDAGLLSRAGVESDIAEFVSQSGGPQAGTAAAPQAGPLPSETADDEDALEFELDDADGQLEAEELELEELAPGEALTSSVGPDHAQTGQSQPGQFQPNQSQPDQFQPGHLPGHFASPAVFGADLSPNPADLAASAGLTETVLPLMTADPLADQLPTDEAERYRSTVENSRAEDHSAAQIAQPVAEADLAAAADPISADHINAEPTTPDPFGMTAVPAQAPSADADQTDRISEANAPTHDPYGLYSAPVSVSEAGETGHEPAVAADLTAAEPAAAEPAPLALNGWAAVGAGLAASQMQPAVQPSSPAAALGEALASPTPPIPDTPVAAPLVADQLRDQPDLHSGAEDTAAAEAAVMDTDLHASETALPTLPDGPDPVASHPATPDADLPAGASAAAPHGHGEALTGHTQADEDEVQAGRPVSGQEAGQEAGEAQAAGPLAHPAPRTTLRLTTGSQALLDLQAQFQRGLGRELPLGLLLGRAAHRHLAGLGLTAAALTDQSGQPLATDLSGPVLAALDQTSPADSATDPATLLVTDAAALGLDELHLGHTSLSLGRTDQLGQVALSLSGEVSAQVGAEFLKAVALSLETPATLLL